MKKTITILGGGMGGTLMAILLAKKNYKVDLYEMRPDIRTLPPLSNRSINQSLSIRGIRVLEEMGLWSALRQVTLIEKGRIVHPLDGQTFFSPYGRNDTEVHYSFNRNTFNSALLDLASASANITIHFQMRCISINRDKHTITFEHTQTKKTRVMKPAIVIGADGVNSIARKTLEADTITKSKRLYLDWGYKSLYVPPANQTTTSLTKETFHIWPRKDCALFALPNLDGSFVFTSFLPTQGTESFSSLTKERDVLRFFKTNFPDVRPLAPLFTDTFLKNKVGHLECLYTTSWHDHDFIVLLGDACHAVMPFYSQGASATFEDCSVLIQCIERFAPHWKQVFATYETVRKCNTDVITDLSHQRFYELKDGFRSKKFLAQEHIEAMLSRFFPSVWKPLYTLIAHTSIPYADAHRRYKIQKWIARLLGMDVLVFVYSYFMPEES